MKQIPWFVRASAGACCAILIALGILSCERECVNCPSDGDGSYNFYLYNYSSDSTDVHRVYVWNSGTKMIADSLPISNPDLFRYIGVTANESHVIVSSRNSRANALTRVISLRNGAIVQEIPYGGPIEVSPLGNCFVIQGTPLVFVHARTFEVLRVDSSGGAFGHFDATGKYFFATASPGIIVRYRTDKLERLPDKVWQRSRLGAAASVTPLINGRFAYVHAVATPNIGQILKWDTETDSTSRLSIVGGLRFLDIELTANDSLVLFTDPTNLSFEGGDVELTIGDVATNTVIGIYPHNARQSPKWVNGTDIAISPDGKYCLFGSESYRDHGVFNLEEMRHEESFWLKKDSLDWAYSLVVACRKWR